MLLHKSEGHHYRCRALPSPLSPPCFCFCLSLFQPAPSPHIGLLFLCVGFRVSFRLTDPTPRQIYGEFDRDELHSVVYAAERTPFCTTKLTGQWLLTSHTGPIAGLWRPPVQVDPSLQTLPETVIGVPGALNPSVTAPAMWRFLGDDHDDDDDYDV